MASYSGFAASAGAACAGVDQSLVCLLSQLYAGMLMSSCDDGLRIAGHFASFLRKRNYQESDEMGDSAFKEAFNSTPFLILVVEVLTP